MKPESTGNQGNVTRRRFAGEVAGRRPALLGLVLILLLTACNPIPVSIRVLHAEALSPLISELAGRFEKNHPQLRIRAEATGSLDVLQNARRSENSFDLLLLDDIQLLEAVPLDRPKTQLYALAGDEIVIATGQRALIEEDREGWTRKWQERISAPGYQIGRADPGRDSSGYLAELVWKLAEIHYQESGLYRRLLARARSGPQNIPSGDLERRLREQELDFCFVYKSFAVQHNLPFFSLPAQLSLGDAAYAHVYAAAFVRIESENGKTTEISGHPIQLGAAVLNSSPAVQEFVDYILSQEARSLYREMGYISIPVRKIQTLSQGTLSHSEPFILRHFAFDNP